MGYGRSRLLLTNPISPNKKNRWTTLNSMSFRSQATKTITASTPDRECVVEYASSGRVLGRQCGLHREGHLFKPVTGWFMLNSHWQWSSTRTSPIPHPSKTESSWLKHNHTFGKDASFNNRRQLKVNPLHSHTSKTMYTWNDPTYVFSCNAKAQTAQKQYPSMSHCIQKSSLWVFM